MARPFAEKLVKEDTKQTALAVVPLQAKQNIHRNNLSPFQEWCISGGVERPFTGDKWYEREVGTYNCVSCDTELFR